MSEHLLPLPFVVFGLQLKMLSGKAYRFIRRSGEMAVPGRSTLQRWIRGFPCPTGIMYPNLKVLQKHLESAPPGDIMKLAVMGCYSVLS